jgi:transposase
MEEIDKEKFRKLHPVGRPSKVSEYEELVKQWLEEPRKPEDSLIKSLEIYTRLVGRGYEGGKTAVYELVRRLRPQEVKAAIVRFEGLPGEFSQHDFGQRRVTFADGTTKVIHFFASRLKYSRTIDVQIVENEQQETVVRCLLRAFERFGGVPLKCVFDNCKTVVERRETRADGFVRVIWTSRFAQLAIDCGFIPIACWPYRPQEKGSVENLVGFVKGNFFSGRSFLDRQDLSKQLEVWVNYVNTERDCDATKEIPETLRVKEPLQSCAHRAQTYAFKVTALVRPTARIRYQGLEYSVPVKLIGQTLTLHLQEQTVQIYLADKFIAIHPRFPENGQSSILPEHAEQLFVSERGKPYAQRQILLDLDPTLEPYLTELVHRRPNAWELDVERMYRLYQQVGRKDFLAAITLATEERCFGSEYLLEISSPNESATLFSSLTQGRKS